MDSELHVLETRDGPIIAACVEQGGQAYETLDARCIAHSLEHGRTRETHPLLHTIVVARFEEDSLH